MRAKLCHNFFLQNRGLASAPIISKGSSILSHEGSNLVKDLIKNDKKSLHFYSLYLQAYKGALEHLNHAEYKLAKQKVDEALSQLDEVHIIPAALGKDFQMLTALLDSIEQENISIKYT